MKYEPHGEIEMIDMTAANYDPEQFLNAIINLLNLKNDAALAIALDIAPPVISRIRNRKLPIGAVMLLRISVLTDLPIREIRSWADSVPAEV